MRYGLKFFATAQSSHGGHLVKQRETQISTKRKFAADDVCPREVERVSVKSLIEDGYTGIAVPALPRDHHPRHANIRGTG